MQTILNDTKDFLRLYLHHTGHSEIPVAYHLWSAIALLAATLADRVWIQKLADSPVKPNLYTMLLGPSAIGKDEAVKAAIKFVDGLDAVNLYNGELTASYMVSALAQGADHSDAGVIDHAKLFLVTPELAMSVGEGEHARAFIRHMTGLYSGFQVPFKKGTAKAGLITVKRSCINWLAGSTAEWLIDAVPPNAIKGGFLGRFIIIPEDYDLARRILRPLYPADRPFIVEYLRARVETLVTQTGEFTLSQDAADMEEYWYANRPAPTDRMLIPTWRRQHDLIYKLGMVMAKARDELSFRIERQDWTRAQQLATVAERGAVSIMSHVLATHESTRLDAVRDLIRGAGEMGHSAALRRSGLTIADFDPIMRTLIARGDVAQSMTQHKTGPPGRVYHWKIEYAPTAEEVLHGDGETVEDGAADLARDETS